MPACDIAHGGRGAAGQVFSLCDDRKMGAPQEPDLPATQGESIVVWAMWALVAATLVVTYTRLPQDELYRVDEGGFAGALGRALVLANWPISLVAIALALVALDALPRGAWWIGGLAIALCATIAVPGVVDELDLDARPVNAVPALGVALAAGLTTAAARRRGTRLRPWLASDVLRVAAAAVVLVLSLPWLAADLGTYFPEGAFITKRVVTEHDGTQLAAVHVGHHHGVDGALLALSAVVLSRVRMTGRRLAIVVAGYLSLLFAYGLVNAVEDFWHEQLVKRGTVDWRIPSALRPDVAWIWLVIVVLAVIAFAAARPRRA